MPEAAGFNIWYLIVLPQSSLNRGQKRKQQSMDNIILCPVPLDQLIQQIREVVRQELSDQKSADVLDKLLSPADAARLFGVVPKTLSAWNKQGLVESQRVGRRVFYKHSNLIAAGKTLKKYKR